MTTVALSKPVPKPEHIPDSLVYDFDMFADPEYLKDPHVRVADLVKNAPPVFWTPRYGGHWMICSHAAVFNAARDVETFTSQIVPRAYIKEMLSKLPPGTPHIPTAIPITLDPPEHTKYRMPLNRPFSPKAINELRASIKELTDSLIDEIKPRGRCEFMREVAEIVPVKVFLKMMGLPLERMAEYREIVHGHLSDPAPNPAEGVKKLWRITATMKDTILERKEKPQNDLISLLWGLQIDGKPITYEDMLDYCVVLFIAGLDTVMNGIGHGMRHFARNPELQAELRKDPSKINDATEEMLRRYTFTIPPRVVAKDTVLEGAPMKKGERAMLFLPTADLDPKEYPNPETFDMNRQNSVHIAFNAGPHRCLGSHLARVELQVVYEQFITRIPPFRLDPANPPTFHGGHVLGIDSLHLLWDV